MKLLILAAGMGSRFGGLKQIEPMDKYNNFIIDYSIYDAIAAGFDEVIFVIKKSMYDDFRNTIGKRVEKLIKVDYAFQELDDLPKGFKLPEAREKPWGTGQALLCAKKYLDTPFVIINADDYYGKESYQIAANYIRSLSPGDKRKHANVTFSVGNTLTENGSVKRGVCFKDSNDHLTNLLESTISIENNKIIATPLDSSIEPFEITNDTTVSMNMFIFTPDIISELETRFVNFLNKYINEYKSEFLVPITVGEIVRDKKADVKILHTTSLWYGVTYKEDKDLVVKAFAKMTKEGLYKEGLY